MKEFTPVGYQRFKQDFEAIRKQPEIIAGMFRKPKTAEEKLIEALKK